MGNNIPANATTTTNGEGAYSPEHFLEESEKALVALNYALVSKNDFHNVRQYFEAILKGEDLNAKCLLLTLVYHFRDIQNGKGLRNPFIESIKLLLALPEYHDFVF